MKRNIATAKNKKTKKKNQTKTPKPPKKQSNIRAILNKFELNSTKYVLVVFSV